LALTEEAAAALVSALVSRGMAGAGARAANELYRPGGYTSGGAAEAVINPVPAAQTSVGGPFFP
jgi:hypothetical protein